MIKSNLEQKVTFNLLQSNLEHMNALIAYARTDQHEYNDTDNRFFICIDICTRNNVI